MTSGMDDLTSKNTPVDVSEFEREQLRFFLGSGDMVGILGEVNPSLAWLPILAGMNLLTNNAILPVWVERNFFSLGAVKDIVENIRFFKAESAGILESRLNAQRDALDPLLARCWRLIIRHIHNSERSTLQNAWFQLAPRLRQGELSAEVLERLSGILTPKLFVSKRLGWYDEPGRKVERPGDVFSIKYEVEDGISEADFFSAWPRTASAPVEEQLVRMLTNSLAGVLADAIDVEVESNVGLSITDVDVPSIAQHEQNAFHKGFLPIVRIVAELWSRLANKSVHVARAILLEWLSSNFRLVHRLALFAAADPSISPQLAARVLLNLPQGELFLTNSQVEVHRLIRGRWNEFSARSRGVIEKRIVAGPPVDWFKEGADLGRPMDSCRFQLLLDIERSGVPLGKQAAELLREIKHRYPKWRDVEPEKAGFTMWQGLVTPVVGTKDKLASVPSEQLIDAAKKAAAEADFMEGDSWLGLCQSEPETAFHGIESAPTSDRWHEWAWRPLLWAANKITNVDELNRMASLVAKWPDVARFDEAASGAAFWMDQVSDKLKAPILWKLWDFIERRSPRRTESSNNDLFTEALNDPSGSLASVLLKRTPRPKGHIELGNQLRRRYETLIRGDDAFAMLARVRLSAAVPFLFERAPGWTTEKLLPFFEWSSPEALAMWSARKYSNHIGSAELFGRTKVPFFELFSRPEVTEEERNVFADWLAAILLANRAGNAAYPLTAPEVRSILRRAGHSSLSSFAHKLAMEMERASAVQKVKVWTEVVGPVFQGAWPLDVELQTPRATFKLVQILLATGAAFSVAVTAIIPFIRAENPRDHTSIYSISQASEDFYRAAPEKLLDLLSAVAGDAQERSLYGLSTALQKLHKVAPQLAQTKLFQRLTSQAAPR